MKSVLASSILLLLMACAPSYNSYYQLDDKYLANRQLETKRFEATNEEAMLVASAQVLQDLGFTLEESETNLGLITGSKNREAGSTAGTVAVVLLAAIAGTQPVYDTEQKIFTTLVSTKNKEAKGFNVRVSFSRRIWNNMGESRIERIQDSEIYKDFFDKLSQSLFLAANDI